MRLDLFMVDRGLCESRNKSSCLIKEGKVTLNGGVVLKPSAEVSEGDRVEITGDVMDYVGRGGLKLEKALTEFSVDVKGAVCADIGSSTGGFTDCLLRNGASKVYAVDSGINQLHPRLREDSRVVSMEGVNARYLRESDIGEKCDVVVMDVSFISQTLLYGCVTDILKDGGSFVSLIKPQFEAGREHVGKNGIVKDEKIGAAVCEKIKVTAAEYGLKIIKIIDSPIRGGDGNKEYLAFFVLKK